MKSFVARKSMGGDRRSHRIEAHGDLIQAPYEHKPGVFLYELKANLTKRGIRVAQSSLSRFFKRRGITRKKDRPRR